MYIAFPYTLKSLSEICKVVDSMVEKKPKIGIIKDDLLALTHLKATS